MKELNDIEEIENFFKELIEKPNARFQLSRIYTMAKRYSEKNDKEDAFKELLGDRRGIHVLQVHILNETDAIIHVEETHINEVRVIYYIILNKKKLYEVGTTFDTAMLIYLSHKYGYERASQMIYNMLRMDKAEEL